MVPIDHFDAAAERHREQTALLQDEVALTYAQLADASHRLGGFFASAAEGDEPVPVVLYAPNDYTVLIGMLGIMRAGGVIVPLHAGNDLETSTCFLQEVQPRCILFHSSLARQVGALRAAVPSLRQFVCLDTPMDGCDSLDAILASPPQPIAAWIDASGNRSRPVFYWATSGSSGRPKAVVEECGHFDVILRTRRGLRNSRRPIGTTLALAPLSHGGGPSSLATLTAGGTVLVIRTFDPREVLKYIERHRVTEMWLPPTALALLLDHPDLGRRDLSSLRSMLLGTAGISVEILRRAVDAFGPCIQHSYGQIETSFVSFFDAATLAACVRGDRPDRLRSSGRSLGVNRVAIMDEEGRLLPPDAEGEIVVRGPTVKPYINAALTAEARRFGWHHTGDIGRLDEDGFVYVTGRVKDVVNMAGFKISAAEVERTIHEIDGIQACAVVAAPDPVRGEVVRAVVVVRPGCDVPAATIVAHCRARFGAGRAPAIVEHWSELPRSPAGKIDKRRLQAEWKPETVAFTGLGGAAWFPSSARS